MGLYGVPLLALFVETIGVWCLWVFRGSKALLAVIAVLNLDMLSFYSPLIPGPEQFLAGHPNIFAAFIGEHIIVGLVAVGFSSK